MKYIIHLSNIMYFEHIYFLLNFFFWLQIFFPNLLYKSSRCTSMTNHSQIRLLIKV